MTGNVRIYLNGSIPLSEHINHNIQPFLNYVALSGTGMYFIAGGIPGNTTNHRKFLGGMHNVRMTTEDPGSTYPLSKNSESSLN